MNVKAIGFIAALTLGGATWQGARGAVGASERQDAAMLSINSGGRIVALYSTEGKVLGIRGDTLILLDKNGSAVPIKVTEATALDKELGQGPVEEKLKADFKEGQKVLATYGLQNLENVAVSIQSKK